MAQKNKDIAIEVLQHVGGASNVLNNTTCMTRLHIRYKDHSKVNLEELKKMDSTFGVVDGDTIQIVFGPGKVTNVGQEFSKITSIPLGSEDDVIDINIKNNSSENKRSFLESLQGFFKHFANIFLPILPGIAGAGLINGITRAINISNNNALVGVWWYALIMTMGWALFMYLPIFVGMNAAKEFGGTPVLGGLGGALSVVNPQMPLLNMINGESIVLPFVNASYNYAVGGILAAVLTGITFAYIERNVRKVIPETLDMFLTPLITLIVGGFISVLIFQYLGTFFTDVIYVMTEFIYTQLGLFGGFILASLQLPLVSIGLHRAFIPLHAILSDPNGESEGINHLLPILMVAGGGQVGAALALYVKTSNKTFKKSILAALPAGILGVGEPLMYGVTLPLLKPFLTACIGSGFGGLMIVWLKVGAISQGVSGIMAPLIMNSGSRINYLIGLFAAYLGGFILTYLFGYEEENINEIFKEEN